MALMKKSDSAKRRQRGFVSVLSAHLSYWCALLCFEDECGGLLAAGHRVYGSLAIPTWSSWRRSFAQCVMKPKVNKYGPNKL